MRQLLILTLLTACIAVNAENKTEQKLKLIVKSIKLSDVTVKDALNMILYLEGDIRIAQVYNRPSLKAPYYKSVRKRMQTNLEEFVG